MLTKGTLLKCKTTTLQNVFGEVVYEITQTGLDAPEPERKAQGIKDGVVATMLGGSGPSARKGFTVVDSEWSIGKDIARGVTEIVPSAKRDSIIAYYEALAKAKGTSGMAGGIEI